MFHHISNQTSNQTMCGALATPVLLEWGTSCMRSIPGEASGLAEFTFLALDVPVRGTATLLRR